MYETHLAMQRHPLAASELGGLGGYKIGAVGAEGEPCIYAPLFRRFLVDAPGGGLSAAAIQMHQLEPEFAVVLGADLPPRADGALHSCEDAWAAVESLVLCIECCGRRATAEVVAAQPRLGRMSDALSAGGVVLGPRLPAARFDAPALAACATQLFVNATLVAEGSGRECPEGGPVQALTWLANHLNGRGLALQKGQLVTTGQTCIYRAFNVGDRVVAAFPGMGRVEMTVAP